MNQGAWYCSQHHMRNALQRLNPKLYLQYAGREASAAPAAGSYTLHMSQLHKFVDQALGLDEIEGEVVPLNTGEHNGN